MNRQLWDIGVGQKSRSTPLPRRLLAKDESVATLLFAFHSNSISAARIY